MSLWVAALLGIVEGLTEFLPVSSTGHLIPTARLAGLEEGPRSEVFEIFIQPGAVHAVVVEYRTRLMTAATGLSGSARERGFVLVSDDAGKSWKAVGTPVVRALTAVAFNGDKLGVAVGHGGSLVRTEDGGNTWTAVPMDEAYGESLLGITGQGDGKFAAYGAFGQYFDTLDGGKSCPQREHDDASDKCLFRRHQGYCLLSQLDDGRHIAAICREHHAHRK